MSKIRFRIYRLKNEKDIEIIKSRNNTVTANISKFYKTKRKYFTKELDEIVQSNEKELEELTHKFYDKLKNIDNDYLPYFFHVIKRIPGGLDKPGYFTGYNFLIQKILNINIFKAILFGRIDSSIDDNYFYRNFVVGGCGCCTGVVGTCQNGDNFLRYELIEKPYKIMGNNRLSLSREKFLENYKGFYKFLYETVWLRESKDIMESINSIVRKNKDKLSFYYKKINPIKRSFKEFYFYMETKPHQFFEISNVIGLEKRLSTFQKYTLEESISSQVMKEFWRSVEDYYIFDIDDMKREEIYFDLYKNIVIIFNGNELKGLHNIIGCYRRIDGRNEEIDKLNKFLDEVEEKKYAVEFF